MIRPGQSESFPRTPLAANVRVADTGTEQPRVLRVWSYCAVIYLAIVILPSLILQRPQPNSWFFKKGLKNVPFATFSRRTYFSKPRMYGMTGGRGPVLKSGPRVER